MKYGTFILDGVNSEDINTLIQARPLIEAPLRKVEFRDSYGTDGDIPIDEGAYSNTDLDLVMLTDGDNLIADRQTLYDLLDSRGVYKEFIPYFDPDKIYRVMLREKAKFENQHYYGEAQTVSANFTVKPYKYLISNKPVTFTGLSHTLVNPTRYSSQPLITIKGSGPSTIKINGVEFVIKEIGGEITIDSERYLAFNEDALGILTPMNHQIGSREYPILKPGSNTILLTGTITEVVVNPRWRSLV